MKITGCHSRWKFQISDGRSLSTSAVSFNLVLS